MSTFSRLLHVHAAAAFDRQLRLADHVGEAEWELDLEAGRLVYAAPHRPSFRVHVLGLEAPGEGWLWAWHASARRWPDSLLESAHRMRALGEETHALPLTTPRLPEGEVDGLALAMVASGACRASGFFRCDVPSGVLYCLLAEPALPPLEQLPAWRARDVFPQVLECVSLQHPALAFLSYLRALGLRTEQHGSLVRGTGPAGTESPPPSTPTATSRTCAPR